jgi:hypothetical protein
MQLHEQQLHSQNMQLHEQQLRTCYMCGQDESHGMKDCPKTIAFLASSTVKINTEGRVVCADGRQLPRGIIGGGRIAKVLKDEAANCKGSASNIELNEESFLIANYECAHLNNQDSKYTVMPVHRADNSQRKDIRTQPYKHPEMRSQAKKSAESPKKAEERKPLNDANDEPPIQKILQCVEPTQNEDVEMESDSEPPKTKPIVKEPMNMNPVKKQSDSKHELTKSNKPKNVTFQDVKIIEPPTKLKGTDKPKPSFKFSSTIQESINQDELLKRILDEPVKVTFCDLLGAMKL